MERNGWRAIIYDAPWARFQTGQTGVIVSEDGKSCETTDNNKSSIKVVAEFNDDAHSGRTGHILFRQKGSDLFDIVCLSQGIGGYYRLEVSGVTIDGCVGMKYEEFLNHLYVDEYFNDERRPITDITTKSHMLVSPKPSDFSTHDDFINNTDKPIIYSNIIVVSNPDRGASAKASITSTTAGEEYEEYKDTVFNGEPTICKSGGGSYDCTIEKISGPQEGAGTVTFDLLTINSCDISYNIQVECTGGEVTFSPLESDNVYKVDFSELEVYEEYDVKKCEETIRTITKPVTAYYSLVEQEGVRVISIDGNKMLISAVEGVERVKVTIATDKDSKTITLKIPSELCQ